MFVDYSGESPLNTALVVLSSAAIGAFISGGINAVSQGISNGWNNINMKEVWINASGGAVSGAIAGTGAGLLVVIPSNALISVSTYSFTQKINGEDISMQGIVLNGALGAISGWIGGEGIFSGSNGKKIIEEMTAYELATALGLKSGQEINKSIIAEHLTSSVVTNTIRTVFSTAVTNIGSAYLQKGDSGYEVKQLQVLLGIEATGEFDNNTEDKLKELQKSLGIYQTGIYGNSTRKALEKAIK